VKSDEVEGGRRAMEESQPRSKVVGGGEEEGGQAQGLNYRLGELSAEISMCKRKGAFCFTNEDSQKQKTLEEPVFDNAVVQASERPHVSYFAHAELARLVVDVESMHTQNTHGSVLGQGRKVAQEEVAQTGSGVGLSGSGPDFPCQSMELERKEERGEHDERTCVLYRNRGLIQKLRRRLTTLHMWCWGMS